MPMAIHTVSASTSRSLESQRPNEASGMAESQSQWLFTESELLLTPSIVEGGLTPEKERENRKKGVNFILQAGIMLKLPQITLATASVFLHRFYMRESMEQTSKRLGYHFYSMAATCLFLATKVEENCRKMKELVVACVRVAQKDPKKVVDEQDKEYWRWRDNILHSEDVLLEALCFDLSLEATYKTLFEMLLRFHAEDNKRMRNAAWAFVNDSCLTQLCLLFSSKTIAASAFHAGARHAGFAIADDELGRPWWELIGVDIQDIRKASNYMAEAYMGTSSKAGREGMLYERTPDIADDMDDKTRISVAHTPNEQQNLDGEYDVSLKRSRASDDAATDGEPPYTNGTIKNDREEDFPRKKPRSSGPVSPPSTDAGQSIPITHAGCSGEEQPAKDLSSKGMSVDSAPERRQLDAPRFIRSKIENGSEEGELDA